MSEEIKSEVKDIFRLAKVQGAKEFLEYLCNYFDLAYKECVDTPDDVKEELANAAKEEVRCVYVHFLDDIAKTEEKKA